MTRDEFLAVRAWITDRWPAMASFTQGQWLAYWEHLQKYERSEAEAALDRYFRGGHEFAPGVSTLNSLCQEVALEGTRRRALPPSHMDGKQALSVFAEQHDGLLPSQVLAELVKGRAG